MILLFIMNIVVPQKPKTTDSVRLDCYHDKSFNNKDITECNEIK